MNRTFFAALLAYLLVITGLASLRSPLLALALPLFLYLVLAVWRGPRQLDLSAERALSAERIQIGDVIKVTLTITNHGPDLEEVLVEDIIPAGLEVVDGSSRHLVKMASGRPVTWTYALRGQRGYYSLSRLQVTARDYFGLVTFGRMLSTSGQLFILPPVLRLRRVAIQPRRTRVYSGSIPARQGGAGVEFYDVREYQSGDSPRWINWRLTARFPQMVYSNQFEQERVADVGIILDGRRRTNEFGRRSIFEHSVLATAAMADAFLSAGNRVGLLFYGKQIVWTFPGYGRIQGERILHDLSRLEPGDTQVFTELYVPRRLFPSRSQLVLVSPLIAEDQDVLIALRTRGYPLLVISPNLVEYEFAGLPRDEETLLAARILRMQRTVLLRRLRRAGIQVMDWDVSRPFEQVAKQHLERHVILPRGARP